MRRRTSRTDRPRDAEAGREKCLRLLGLRARSAGELRGRLRRDGYSEGVIESVLTGLEQSKLVDDEEFARAWVEGRQVSGGAGRQKLRWELRQKGVSKEIIQRVVDEATDDEAELCRALRLAESRLGGRPLDGKERARLQRLLLARGFEYGTVDTVLRRISGDREDD